MQGPGLPCMLPPPLKHVHFDMAVTTNKLQGRDAWLLYAAPEVSVSVWVRAAAAMPYAGFRQAKVVGQAPTRRAAWASSGPLDRHTLVCRMQGSRSI